MPFADSVELLRSLGFLREWSVEQARAAADQLWDDGGPEDLTGGDAGALLQRYYGDTLGDRGRSEGVVTLDRRFGAVSRTWLEDLRSLCGVPVTGQHETLPSALATMNAALAESNLANRYFTLDVGIDFHVVACRPRDFELRIATTSWLTLGSFR